MTEKIEKPTYDVANQNVYDSFNTFIFSKNTSIINKLLTRHEFYLKCKELPGSIVECGVFKGSGVATWLKIMNLYEPNSNKKVIGFDFFESAEETSKKIDENNYECKDALKEIVKRGNNDLQTSFDIVKKNISCVSNFENRFDLVKGDIKISSREYCEKNPGFYISLLYLDLDVGEPTYWTLKNLWDRILPGGIIIFDEYQAYFFNEASGINKFLKEIGYEYNIKSTLCGCPDAYMIKK
jgi:hypothetical protein